MCLIKIQLYKLRCCTFWMSTKIFVSPTLHRILNTLAVEEKRRNKLHSTARCHFDNTIQNCNVTSKNL